MSSCELKLLAMICYITRSKPNICFAKQKQCHVVAIWYIKLNKCLFYRMTLVEKELVTAREISEAEEIFDDPTNPDPTSSWHQYIFPYLPVTYLGILCIVGIISNSLVIFFFAACPVVSHSNSSKIVPALATLYPKLARYFYAFNVL